MEIALIYATKHGHTKKVVDNFKVDCAIFNVRDKPDLEPYDLVVFFCPTYGDEELPLDMEDFLVSLKVKNKKFVICELGNYYGYDDFEFGAMKIIKSHLSGLGWTEAMPGLSLDSLPKTNWQAFYEWHGRFNEFINGCSG